MDPIMLDDISPSEISTTDSIELLMLVSDMLSSDRNTRPTAL